MAWVMGAGVKRPESDRSSLWSLLRRLFTPQAAESELANNKEHSSMHQPLASIVDALQALHGNRREIDSNELREEPPERPDQALASRQDHLEAIDHLERAMAFVEPDRLREAAAQVLIAARRIDNLQDQIDEAPLCQDLDVVRRLLRHASPVLAREAGLDPTPFNGARGHP